jgi:hypothetical protein
VDKDSLPAQPPHKVPGATDSAVLMLDALLALLRLVRAEAVQAVMAWPQLLALNVYRWLILLLAWVSFGVLIGCSVYVFTESSVYAVGSFFLLQLSLMVLLEQGYRRLHARLEFRETRKGLAGLQGAIKERFDVDLR